MPANQLPFIKFFPADWLSDEKLRLVSIGARGLWVDMLCLMAKAERRGYLELSQGCPVPMENLARLVGVSVSSCTKLVAELESAGVFSRDEAGVIFNRRLVRDTEFRLKASEAGRRGGNPAITHKHTLKGSLKGQANAPLLPQRLRGSEAQKSNPADPAEPGRSRDVLFDALAIAEGSDPKQLTKDGARRVAVALAQIKAVCPELSISEIQRRAKAYRAVMPQGSRLTANALAVNWAKCGGGVTPAPKQPDLPAPPEGWRTMLEEAYPGNLVNREGKAWADVPDNIRAEVFGLRPAALAAVAGGAGA